MSTSSKSKNNRQRGLRQRGSALLTVLWLTAALSAIGLAVASNVRSETERTETGVDDARAYFIARGAIERAVLHMLWGRMYRDPAGRSLYYTAGSPTMELSFPSAEAHVEIVPESSKVSINFATPDQLLRLLLALGVAPDRAATLAAAIVDWRTPLNPLNGSPFDDFYRSQSPSFLARHASFTETEELLLVQGMTPDFYYGNSMKAGGGGFNAGGLRDCVTVFDSNGQFDINTAQPATLQSAGIEASDVAAILKLRAQHPILDGRELQGIVQALGPAGGHLTIGGRTIFTLRATARMKQPDGKLSDLRRTVSALVKMDTPGNGAGKLPGWEVLRWYDRN